MINLKWMVGGQVNPIISIIIDNNNNNNNNNNNSQQLLNEAEYIGYEELSRSRRSYPPRPITPAEIRLILHILRKPNSLITLLFIQNNS